MAVQNEPLLHRRKITPQSGMRSAQKGPLLEIQGIGLCPCGKSYLPYTAAGSPLVRVWRLTAGARTQPLHDVENVLSLMQPIRPIRSQVLGWFQVLSPTPMGVSAGSTKAADGPGCGARGSRESGSWWFRTPQVNL